MQPGEEEAVFFVLMLHSVKGMMPVEHGAEGQGRGEGVGEGSGPGPCLQQTLRYEDTGAGSLQGWTKLFKAVEPITGSSCLQKGGVNLGMAASSGGR